MCEAFAPNGNGHVWSFCDVIQDNHEKLHDGDLQIASKFLAETETAAEVEILTHSRLTVAGHTENW